MCDAGCEAHFNADHVMIECNGQSIINGQQDHTTGLWFLDIKGKEKLTMEQQAQANILIHASDIADLIKCLHHTCFAPTVDTWIQSMETAQANL